MALKVLDELKAEYDTVLLKKDMTYLGILSNEGDILLTQKRYKEALVSFDVLIGEIANVLPDHKMYQSHAYATKAVIFKALGELDKAIGAYRRSLLILEEHKLIDNPDYARYQKEMGALYIQKGAIDKSITVLDSAYQWDLKDKEFVYSSRRITISTLLADAYLEKGNYSKARDYLQPLVDTFVVRDTLDSGLIQLKNPSFLPRLCPVVRFLF